MFVECRAENFYNKGNKLNCNKNSATSALKRSAHMNTYTISHKTIFNAYCFQ
jgi:hypothetical protein